MEPTLEEIPLMEEIMDGIEDDQCDAVVDGWMRVLGHKHQIWFENLYNEDVAARNVVESVHLGNQGQRKGKGIENESCFDKLKDLMEGGLKDLTEKMTQMEKEVSDKLAVLDKKVKYVMRYVPPMDEETVIDKVVSTDLEDDLSVEEVEGSGIEKEKEVGDLEKDKELADLESEKEADLDKEKKKAKKRKLSYSELVTGPFKPPNTRSRKNPS